MFQQEDIQILKESGIRTFECSICGCEIPNTKFHNPYYGYDEYRYGEEGLCDECLGHAFHIGSHPPQFVITPSGPVRLGKSITLPFFNGMWFVIRCE